MMMSNLFSIFDPSLSLFSISWISCFLFLLILPTLLWINSTLSLLIKILVVNIKMEINYILNSPNKGSYLFIISIFLMILIFNFLALFPFLFSLTSHVIVTLPLSFSFWLGIIIFSWMNFLKNFLTHLIPTGTPFALMSFMVVVEMLSNFIRPLALTFRLTANMMAGHLLMSLIGGALMSLNLTFMVMGSLIQSLLVFMELGVSIIQSYVFSTLILLYMSESK